MMCSSVPSVSKPGKQRRRAGARRVASSHSDDGPGRMRMPWPRPDRVPVVDALGVVPHPVAVDQARAGGLADRRASGRRRGRGRRRSSASAACPSRSGQFWRTRSWLPPMPPEVTITAPALSSNSPTTSRELGLPARDRARAPARCRVTPVDGAVVDGQLVDPVAEAQVDQPAARGLAHAPRERLDHPRPGAPGDVEARAPSCRGRRRS